MKQRYRKRGLNNLPLEQQIASLASVNLTDNSFIKTQILDSSDRVDKLNEEIESLRQSLDDPNENSTKLRKENEQLKEKLTAKNNQNKM